MQCLLRKHATKAALLSHASHKCVISVWVYPLISVKYGHFCTYCKETCHKGGAVESFHKCAISAHIGTLVGILVSCHSPAHSPISSLPISTGFSRHTQHTVYPHGLFTHTQHNINIDSSTENCLFVMTITRVNVKVTSQTKQMLKFHFHFTVPYYIIFLALFAFIWIGE